MSPTPPARRRRLGLPRRVFSQVLLMQLAIAAGVAVLATGLFLAPLSDQLDDQAMRRALAIAQTTAAQPQIAEDLAGHAADAWTVPSRRRPSGSGRPPGPSTSWSWTRRGVRWSHTDPERDRQDRLDRPEPAPWPARRSWRSTAAPWAARPAARCRCATATDKIVGAVSVGIAYDSVRARLIHAIPGLLAYAGGALAVGALAA